MKRNRALELYSTVYCVRRFRTSMALERTVQSRANSGASLLSGKTLAVARRLPGGACFTCAITVLTLFRYCCTMTSPPSAFIISSRHENALRRRILVVSCSAACRDTSRCFLETKIFRKYLFFTLRLIVLIAQNSLRNRYVKKLRAIIDAARLCLSIDHLCITTC